MPLRTGAYCFVSENDFETNKEFLCSDDLRVSRLQEAPSYRILNLGSSIGAEYTIPNMTRLITKSSTVKVEW